jgi:hypothetical protein
MSQHQSISEEYYKLFKSDTSDLSDLSDESNGYIYSDGLNVAHTHDDCTDPKKCKYNNYGNDFNIYNLDGLFYNLYLYGSNPYIGRCKLAEDSTLTPSTNRFRKGKFKTNKFYLESIQTLEDFFDINPEMRLKAVKQSGIAIRFIKDQTLELCKAVRSPYYFKYIKDPTPEMCLEAVKEYPHNLKYVREQTPEMCIIAVKQYYECKEFVKPENYKYIQEILEQHKEIMKKHMYVIKIHYDPDIILHNKKDDKPFKSLAERFKAKNGKIRGSLINQPRLITTFTHPVIIPDHADDTMYDICI